MWPIARPARRAWRAGPADAADGRRTHLQPNRASTWWCRTCSGAASWTSSPTRPTTCGWCWPIPTACAGEATRTLTVRTRPEPKPYAGGRVFHVYPHGFKGTKIEPAFEGLMCAYNFWCAGTDWATSGRPRVRPGDTILVHAGVYKYNRYEYTNNAAVNRTTPLDGTYYLTADGTAGDADRDQGGGRRAGDLRRRRRVRAVRRARGRLHLLRGPDVPERRDGDPGGHAVHRRRQGSEREAEPVRERRRGHLHQLRRLQQLLHRRQHLRRPQRPQPPDRLGGRRCGRSSTASRDRSSRRRWRPTSP